MKETKIAKENVEFHKCSDGLNVNLQAGFLEVCSSHKQTCQRWLEFLEEFKWIKTNTLNFLEIMKKKRDLKQAIKLYDEAEI